METVWLHAYLIVRRQRCQKQEKQSSLLSIEFLIHWACHVAEETLIGIERVDAMKVPICFILQYWQAPIKVLKCTHWFLMHS